MKVCHLRSRLILSMWIIVAVSTNVAKSSDVQDLDTVPTNSSNFTKFFDSQGRLTVEGLSFTTKAYPRQALRLILEEANDAAIKLQLPEGLPICETNIARKFIATYGASFLPPGGIGGIDTRNYSYFVSVGHKLSFIDQTHSDEHCRRWREEYVWPKSRVDTNAAYQLAVSWLAAAGMDVDGLNTNCTVKVNPNPYWNAGLPQKGTFVPIYDVFWLSSKNRAENYGDTAFVSLFLPTKTLISLNVRDSKYILRKPLIFTNLDFLLSQTNNSRQTIAP